MTLSRFFAILLVALVVACGGTDGKEDIGQSHGSGSTIPVTAALLDSLPPHAGSTLVREWLAEGGRIQVREYAVSQPPAVAADAITRHFQAALLAQGWLESEALAAISSFTKDGRRIVIGRVGPQIQEAPSGSTVLTRVEPPTGSAFFYTL